MFQGLFLEGDDVGEIDDRHSSHTLLHKFNPDGKSGLRAAFAFTQGNLFVVEADPYACSDLRREADEPSVSEVLRSAGFAASGSANHFGFHGGTELNDLFEHGGHGARSVRRENIVNFRMSFFEKRAIVAGDFTNHVRVDANAVVRKDGEGGDVFDEFHVGGAERERKIWRQCTANAKAAGHVDDGIDANFFSELHCRHVARASECAAESDGAFKFFVVIVGRIGLATTDDGKRCIDDGVEGRRTLLDGGGINVGLEGTADLAVGLRSAIELGIFKTVAADHGFNFAGGVVDGNHGALRSGKLLELDSGGSFAKLLNGELSEIADS